MSKLSKLLKALSGTISWNLTRRANASYEADASLTSNQSLTYAAKSKKNRVTVNSPGFDSASV